MSNGLKMAILGLKMVSLDSKMAMDIFENTFIWSAAKSCTMESGINNYLIPSCLSNVKKILKMAISGLKMAILNFEMAMDISENTFIWSAAKICTMESGIIHFDILFYSLLTLKCHKGLKMAILGLQMAILDLKTAMDLSKIIFI